MPIHYPQVAGSFYPDDPKELSQMLDIFLDEVKQTPFNNRLRALICPHAGYIFSGQVAAYGYKLLENLEQTKEWQIILLGPAHFTAFAGVSVLLSDYWQTPLGNVKILKNIGQSLLSNQIIDFITAYHSEHSLEAQLPFLQKTLKNFTILPLLIGQINYQELAKILEPLLNLQTILIVSSDLSHYYPYNKAVILDNIANSAVPNLDIKKVETEVEACGKIGILTLIQLSLNLGWKGKLLNYRNSGDTFGDKAQVVGYGAYAFYGN